MDQEYLRWLRSQVDFIDMPNDYGSLFYILGTTMFYAVIPMDENRAKDGIALRREYYHDILGMEHGDYPMVEATVLEVLVAISKKINYICSSYDEDKTKEIFWRLLDNLGIAGVNDHEFANYGGDVYIHKVLDKWMSRKFRIDGTGGLFPMAAPKQNQREVEIWYQMNQYLNDPNGQDLKGY